MNDISMDISSFASMTDEEVCACVRSGTDAGMDYLLNKYKTMVRAKARTCFIVGGDQDDLIQEGMIGLMRAIQKYDASQGAGFHTFARICVDRQIEDAIRAAGRDKHRPLNSYVSLYQPVGEDEEQRIALMDVLPQTDSDPETAWVDQESRQVIIDQLKTQLSFLERQVLDVFLEGYTISEIAVRIGKSEKSVDNALVRIKRKAAGLR